MFIRNCRCRIEIGKKVRNTFDLREVHMNGEITHHEITKFTVRLHGPGIFVVTEEGLQICPDLKSCRTFLQYHLKEVELLKIENERHVSLYVGDAKGFVWWMIVRGHLLAAVVYDGGYGGKRMRRFGKEKIEEGGKDQKCSDTILELGIQIDFLEQYKEYIEKLGSLKRTVRNKVQIEGSRSLNLISIQHPIKHIRSFVVQKKLKVPFSKLFDNEGKQEILIDEEMHKAYVLLNYPFILMFDESIIEPSIDGALDRTRDQEFVY
ncbi:hypothetical protein OSB04_029413 [Centaurea solstitialis]|uniref:Uncharacterized protein n=1 Tax=Centaurea solstitialis TaxID=347529 RepID=A0AA38T151_9ASTR|nr:hypothetical protein OSB04_029413 [Centaurea solstitialis]